MVDQQCGVMWGTNGQKGFRTVELDADDGRLIEAARWDARGLACVCISEDDDPRSPGRISTCVWSGLGVWLRRIPEEDANGGMAMEVRAGRQFGWMPRAKEARDEDRETAKRNAPGSSGGQRPELSGLFCKESGRSRENERSAAATKVMFQLIRGIALITLPTYPTWHGMQATYLSVRVSNQTVSPATIMTNDRLGDDDGYGSIRAAATHPICTW
ncbi:hypothetical protein B0T22DRAFT_443659 [Podospora appendiculata]|uniref:Uncharacterized protein n=1 Tax=Podospora appendiculata TaxID=314037 RepID=A0AAE0X2P1_9PEZI|nr:hypothetical protein B0T22DRAFT_443659 [Podospora appendiculata]